MYKGHELRAPAGRSVQPEVDRSTRLYGVREVPTILVIDQNGNRGLINAADFDPQKHVPVG